MNKPMLDQLQETLNQLWKDKYRGFLVVGFDDGLIKRMWVENDVIADGKFLIDYLLTS